MFLLKRVKDKRNGIIYNTNPIINLQTRPSCKSYFIKDVYAGFVYKFPETLSAHTLDFFEYSLEW
ncbi:MAG TPA: hypothetical protein DIW24_09520 [Bacteroidetes bacterium]|nr:hypothetical protein [Bacteroidota bacterium]